MDKLLSTIGDDVGSPLPEEEFEDEEAIIKWKARCCRLCCGILVLVVFLLMIPREQRSGCETSR